MGLMDWVSANMEWVRAPRFEMFGPNLNWSGTQKSRSLESRAIDETLLEKSIPPTILLLLITTTELCKILCSWHILDLKWFCSKRVETCPGSWVTIEVVRILNGAGSRTRVSLVEKGYKRKCKWNGRSPWSGCCPMLQVLLILRCTANNKAAKGRAYFHWRE